MEAIYIPHLLRMPEQTDRIQVKDYLSGLDTLTPVQGQVRVTHRGNYLEVAATAETIMTLTCDRCLQQYNHRLAIDTSELIWLQDPVEEPEISDVEHEIPFDDLVETLPPQGYFQPDRWLYEHLCLEIPQRQLCDQRCQGIQVADSQGAGPVPPAAADRRWASLESLKGHFPG